MAVTPQDQANAAPEMSTLAAQGGQGFAPPQVAAPAPADVSAAQNTQQAAQPAPAPQPAQQDSGGGGGGFWGFVDHAAHAVTGVVSKVANAIPGVSQVGNALNRVYTDVVSHPLSDILTMANEADFQHAGPGFFFKSSNWVKAWQASQNISPGQAVVTGFNNGGVGFGPLFGAKVVDPEDPNAIAQLMKGNSLASVASGATDMAVRTFADPTSLAGKAIAGKVADIKNAPIKATTNIEATVTSRAGAKLTEQVSNNNAGPLAMNKNLQLKAVKASSNSYGMASALTAAGSDIGKIQEIQRLVAGDVGALDRLATDSSTLSSLRAAGPGEAPLVLHQNLPAELNPAGSLIALRASAQFMPADIEFKSALSAMDPAELDNWFATPSKMKTAHAQAAIADKMAEIESYRQLFGTGMARTSGDLAPGIGRARAALRASTPSAGSVGAGIKQLPGDFADSVRNPTHFQQLVQNHVADPIIRMYHTFSDARATRMIDFGSNEAVNQVRSLLNTSSVLSPEDKDGLLSEFGMKNLQGKAQSQLAFNALEKHLHEVTAEHYGLTPELGETAYHEYAARRQLYISGVGSKAYGTLNGDAVFPTHDGQVVTDPYLETQLANGAIPMADMRDYEVALQQVQKSGLASHLVDAGNSAHGMLTSTLDNIYGYYKPLVMLTGHRAFNHVGDDLIRSMVKVGAMASVQHAVQGTADFLRNRVTSLTKPLVVRNLEGKWQKEVNDLKATYDATKVRFSDQQSRMGAGEKVAPQNLVSTQDVLDAKQAYLDRQAQGPGVPQKLRLGEGTFRVPGTNIQFPELFGGVDGPYMRTILSSDKTFDDMFDKSAASHYNSQQTLADHDIITPRDGVKAHGAALVRQINNQLRNDPVAKMMYEGKTDSQIRDWMMKTAPGQLRMRNLHIGNPMDNIEMVRDSMNTYLPTYQLKQKAFSSGGVTPKDIELAWPNASARPPVSGNLALLPHTGGGHESFVRNSAQKLIKITGSLPDDLLVRHPMASALYKTNFTRLVKQAGEQGYDVQLGSDLYNTLHKAAIQDTKNTMQQTLYDSSRFVSAGHTLRFVAPFFNAWHNAMTSWSHLIAQNPQLVARGIEAKHALWNAPFAVDRNTGQQANDKTSMNDLVFVMHMPKGVAKSLGMGDLSDIPISAQTVVSPTYADSVLSPGFGPLVAIPANHLVKNDPNLLTNPFLEQITGGRVTANDLQAAIPSVATQFMDTLGMAGITGDSSSEAQNAATTAWSIYQDQYYDYLNGKRSAPPSMADAQNQGKWLNAISGFVNRLMPLGFKPQSNMKFLTDAYHNMLTANNGDVNLTDEQFYDKYGTAGFVYTQSLSKNVGGIAATQNAVSTYAKYKGLIAKDPSLAAVVVGPDGNGAFDDAAYQWEVANGLRSQLTPTEAAAQEQTNLGWTLFDKINNNIQAQLTQRGLTSLNDKQATDLKTLKSLFINSTGDPTSQYYNPDFYTSYGSYNPNAYQVRIQSLQQISQDQSLLANPLRSDIRSLNQYFQVRSLVYDALQQRGQQGGSTSLSTKSNLDIAQAFADEIGQLKANDTKFGPLFERYLAKDDLKEPS